MAGRAGADRPYRQKAATPFTIWERYGITEHLGGIPATQAMARLCYIEPGQRILDIGCGTGYTACYLAENYQAHVVATDVTSSVLDRARKRVARLQSRNGVALLRGDAHALGFRAESFDVVFLESVMVFCDAPKVISEIYRILKHGGVVADNELTLLKPAPDKLKDLLVTILGVQPPQCHEWQEILKGAGFDTVSSTVHKMNLWHQFTSHLKADGLGTYVSTVLQSTRDPYLWKTFFNREMLAAARLYIPYVGYGLYVAKKRR